MPSPSSIHEATEHPPQDEGGLLLWQIARRADELVQQTGRGPGLNRICWLIAERELAGHLAEAAMLVSHEEHLQKR